MSRRTLILGLVSLITVASFILMVYFNQSSGLPFANKISETSGYLIKPLPDTPLPTGLQNNDQLELNRMTSAARVAVVFGSYFNIRPGLSYDMVVRRGNQILTVPVTSRLIPQTPISRLNNLYSDGVILGFLVLGLLSLWRGRNLAAWGLGLFSVSLAFINTVRAVPVTAMQGVGLYIFVVSIGIPLLLLGLYLMARGLAGAGLGRTANKAYALTFLVTILLYLAVTLGEIISVFMFGQHPWPVWLPSGLSILAGFVPGIIFASGYRRADPENRLRMRWILYATGLLALVILLQATQFLSDSQVYESVIQVLVDLALVLVLLSYTYAVLRNRLVDVRIAINRTLVYGVITAIVVGVFAAISSLTARATLGQGASLLLQLIVPLALGIVLSSLRKYVDIYINRFLFHRQFRAEKALNDFARTCGFIEQPEHLLDLTAQQIFEHSLAQGVALYEHETGGYRRVRQQGTAGFPERVVTDDLAFVRLRAGDPEADLHEFNSALGTVGYVFSMAVRGKLIGALVCGPRPAEQYTTEERALLFHVAQQAGAALHALRSRAHEKFVDSVATGALDADSAREQARQLMAVWQPA